MGRRKRGRRGAARSASSIIFLVVSRFIPLDRVLGRDEDASRPAASSSCCFARLVLLYLILPILIIVPMSFSSARFLTFPPPSLSLRWYREYHRRSRLDAGDAGDVDGGGAAPLRSQRRSASPRPMRSASRSSASCASIHITLLLPLVVPIIITAVGIFFVYAKVGLVATMSGLVLANVMLGLPYVIISVVAGLQSFDADAGNGGAQSRHESPAQLFRGDAAADQGQRDGGRQFSPSSRRWMRPSSRSFISGGQYQPLTKRMFTALRDEIDPTIAAISTLMTAASFMLVLIASTRKGKAPDVEGKRRALLTVRQFVFRHDTLYLVGLDAVSETSVCLDRHALNDGVNLRYLDMHPPLRPLTAMEDFVV